MMALEETEMAELGMIVDPVKSHRKREKLKGKLLAGKKKKYV